MWIEKTKTGLRLVDRIKVNGITKRVSVPLEKDTPQARKKATERLLEKTRANTQPLSEMRLKEAVEDYLSLKTDCKESTIIDLKNNFKNAYLFLGDPKLCELNPAMLRRAIYKSEKAKDKPQTVNRCIRVMRTFCAWCVDMEYLPDNPMKNIRLLKEIKAEKKPSELYLEKDRLQDLLSHLHDIPYYLTRFLALTGCRIGEALALTPEDIGSKYITINKSFSEASHQITTPKNSSSIRQVFIQPELRELLNEYLHWRQINIMAYGIRPKTLFYANTGAIYRERYYRLLLHPHGVHPHMLRHTHVALLAEQGMSLEAIARRIGHNGTEITRRVYYHVTEKQKEKDESTMASIRIL